MSLIAFPAGRVRGLTRWLLACLAVPVVFGLLPQIGVAAVLTLVALLVQIEGRRGSATAYPTVAAIAVVAYLASRGWSGVCERRLSIQLWPLWRMNWCS